MLQSLVIWSLCLLTGLVALAVCGWVAVSGQFFTMDGLLLVAISLALGGAFAANFLWSVRTGEVQEVLSQLRKKRAKPATESEPGGGITAPKGE